MQFSPVIQSTAPVSISPNGNLIARLTGENLEVVRLPDLEVLSSFSTNVKKGFIRWSVGSPDHECRLLLQTSDEIRVWDLSEPKWTSTINNGSGGMGKIVSANFGPSKQEVVILNDFGSKMTIWSLISGRSVEIRDPKSISSSHDFRPATGHLAFLARPAAQDIVTIHQPESYTNIRSVNVGTHDAQGIKWSPDGKWLAIWDTASIGSQVQILTADGAQFRMVKLDGESESSLGIKCISWSLSSQQLAIGKCDRQVEILNTRTFSPIMTLTHHYPTHGDHSCMVWQEISADHGRNRSYQPVTQPIALPPNSNSNSDPMSKIGISMLAYDSASTFLATKDEASPSTVWIWNVASKNLETIIIQLSLVRRLEWHPTIPGLLHIHVELEEAAHIYLWSHTDAKPLTYRTPFERANGRVDIKWASDPESSPSLLVNDERHALLCWSHEAPLNVQGGVKEIDDSFDSLYEALTGEAGHSP